MTLSRGLQLQPTNYDLDTAGYRAEVRYEERVLKFRAVCESLADVLPSALLSYDLNLLS